MFLHNLKYEIKINFREKSVIIWMLLFPIFLGIIYKAAFGNIYEEGSFDAIHTAVVENETDQLFHAMVDELGVSESTLDKDAEKLTLNDLMEKLSTEVKLRDEDDPPFLYATYCTEDEAYDMLDKGEVTGIIFIDAVPGAKPSAEEGGLNDLAAALDASNELMEDGSLGNAIAQAASGAAGFHNLTMEGALDILTKETVLSLKLRKNGIEETILKQFVDSYMSQAAMTRKIVNSDHPEDAGDVMNAAVIRDLSLTDGNKDPFASYMYNLIATVALFGMTVALHIALFSEANLSDYGARRSCSATPKIITILSGLAGCSITMIICVAVCTTFEAVVLGTDFGPRLPLVYLTGFLGAIMGVCVGFFIGAIGKISYGAKIGITMAIVMTLSFMSGLMISQMHAVFELYAPIVNDLNPAAIIVDALYYLNMDATLDRFLGKIFFMVVYSVVFVFLGFLLTRRRKYANL
ncbi:MAG: ABC transporter permease [Lachnospiraceae bacterium]|nr:ABC transporter permease [Lachnospiraceae bacterium]